MPCVLRWRRSMLPDSRKESIGYGRTTKSRSGMDRFVAGDLGEIVGSRCCHPNLHSDATASVGGVGTAAPGRKRSGLPRVFQTLLRRARLLAVLRALGRQRWAGRRFRKLQWLAGVARARRE